MPVSSVSSGSGSGSGSGSRVAVSHSCLWLVGSVLICLLIYLFCLLVDFLAYLLHVAGLSPGWVQCCSGLGQATYTCVPLSPSSIIWC